MTPAARLMIALVLSVTVMGGFWILLRGRRDALEVPPPSATPDAPHPPPAPSEVAGVSVDAAAGVVSESAEGEPSDAPREGPGTLRGVIQGEDGKPVAQVSVRVEASSWRVDERLPPAPRREHVTADEEGRFEVRELPVGRYGLLATGDGRVGSAWARISAADSVQEMTITLGPSGSIRGNVRNAAGAGIGGALVTIKRRDDSNGDFAVYAALLRSSTDDEGSFVLGPIPDTSWQLWVRARGYAPLLTDVIEVGSTEVEITLGRGARVAGAVVEDGSGVPLSGITVVLRSAFQEERHTTKSDELGAFSFVDVRDAVFELDVDHPRLVIAGGIGVVTVEGARSVEDLRLALTVGGTVSGRVYDARTGAGVEGVSVQAYAEPPRRNLAGHVVSEGSATSTRDGEFRIEGIPEGPRSLRRGPAPGYASAQWNDRVLFVSHPARDVEGLDFPLERGIAITGKVVDREGNPIAKATIQGTAESGGAWHTARSQENGEFELVGFQYPGRIDLNVRHEGLAFPREASFHLPEEGLAGIVLTMVPESMISGTVVDAVGSAAAGVVVVANPQGNRRFGANFEEVDLAGAFTLRGLPEGRYALQVRSVHSNTWGSAEPRGTTVFVGEGESVRDIELVWRSTTGLEIAGQINDVHGAPIARASVHAGGASGGGHAITDDEGYFRIAGLLEGSYAITARHERYSTVDRTQVRAGDSRVDFTLLGRGSIEGRVRSAEDGEPIESFEIAHLRGHVSRREAWMQVAFARVHHREGRFLLTAVEAGEVTLVARAPGFAETLHFIGIVPAEGMAPEVEVTLRRGISATGRVVSREGAPVAGASVYVGSLPTVWQRGRWVATQTDQEGRFTLTTLSPETTRISATHSGYAAGSVEFTAGKPPDDLRVILSRGATLEGVVRVGGQARPGCWVSVHQPNARDASAAPSQTDSQGRFQVKGVLAGTASVNVGFDPKTGRHRSLNRMVTVPEPSTTGPSRTVTVDIDFAAADAMVWGTVHTGTQDPQQLQISLSIAGDWGTEHFNEALDENGTYRFAEVPAGKGILRVSSSHGGSGGFRQLSDTVEIQPDSVVRRDFDLQFGARVTGQLSGWDDHRYTYVAALRGEIDIGDLSTEIFAALQTKIALTAQISDDGSFHLEGLEEGTYTILAIAFSEPPKGPEDFAKGRHTTRVVTLVTDEEVNLSLALP